MKSGIFTLANEKKRVEDRNIHYSGSYADLLSPDTPPQIYIDGQPTSYTGQGAFISKDDRWYVGVDDFANIIQAELKSNKKNINLIKGKKNLQIVEANLIQFNNKFYAPILELTKLFDLSASFIEEKNNNQQIYIYSSQLTEEQLLTSFPTAATVPAPNNNFDRPPHNIYIVDGKQVKLASEDERVNYKTYQVAEHIFVFKDNKLMSIEHPISLDAVSKGLARYQPSKSVTKIFGNTKKIVINELESILAYPTEKTIRMFKLYYDEVDKEVIMFK